MPANLNYRYINAEKEYRRASTPREELECLQVMLRELPKHKGTDKLQADLKRRIRLAKEVLAAPTQSTRAGSAVHRIVRQGAGQVVLLGGPNAGKSQLLKTLTRAEPEVASYPFTTQSFLPGMMSWTGVPIQLIDTPPVVAGGLDPDLLNLIRTADLVLLMVDLGEDEGGEQLMDVFQEVQASKTRLGVKTRIASEDVGVTYRSTMVVWNKIDAIEAADRKAFFCDWMATQDSTLWESFQSLPWLDLSTSTGIGLEALQQAIFESLDVVRVFTKDPRAKEPDLRHPFALPRGSTLLELAEMIHADLAKSIHSARVWGAQVHDATVVTSEYQPEDGDIVEILTR